MPLLKRIDEGDTHIGVWHIKENLSELMDFLPKDNRVYYEVMAQGFNAEKRKIERIGARVLLQELVEGQEKIVAYNGNGKPYLVDQSFSISISHSGPYIAVALGKWNSVGIDIEVYSGKAEKVASKFINDDERILPCDGDLSWPSLLVWSAKETVFKCMKFKGTLDFKEYLHTYPFQLSDSGYLIVKETKTFSLSLFKVQYEKHADFILTWIV